MFFFIWPNGLNLLEIPVSFNKILNLKCQSSSLVYSIAIILNFDFNFTAKKLHWEIFFLLVLVKETTIMPWT